MAQELRTYQEDALQQLRIAISHGNKALVLSAPTGSGKTTIASAMAKKVVERGIRFFFIVDSVELVDQAATRFTDDGMSVGVIQGQHELTDYSCQVQVATIQTLRRRWDDIPTSLRPGFIVIDECHVLHTAHEEIITWAKENEVLVIGLSATPFRKGLGKTFDTLVRTITVSSLMKEGYLCPYKAYAPSTPDLDGVKKDATGDYNTESVAEAMSDVAIVGDIVNNWLKNAEGRQTIVFCANVAHSKLVCKNFKKAGVNCDHVDGYTNEEERNRVINGFRDGSINVITNVAVLTKGFDAPATSCIVLARPTYSLMMHIQQIGRGLRIAPGKTDCLIFDHAGNIGRNGLPCREMDDELDDGKNGRNLDRRNKEKKEPLEKACGNCSAISTQHVCPFCGFKPEFMQDIEVIDGELYEITTGKIKFNPTLEDKRELYAQFLGFSRARGYKDGWAYHKVAEWCGTGLKETKGIKAKRPTEATHRIIKSLERAHSKSKSSQPISKRHKSDEQVNKEIARHDDRKANTLLKFRQEAAA